MWPVSDGPDSFLENLVKPGGPAIPSPGMKEPIVWPEAAAKALRSVSLPDICRVEDLAHHLGVSQSAVRAALRAGRLPGRRVGRRWLIPRPALLESLRHPEAARSDPGHTAAGLHLVSRRSDSEEGADVE